MHIVILGGGFAGLSAANKLKQRLRGKKDVQILLIDKNDYTTMIPSLPDLAGGGIEKSFLTERIEKLIPKGVHFRKASVEKIDFTSKQIFIGQETITYDYLIVAVGSKTNFFGFDQNLDKLYTLESLEDSLRICRDFEKALNSGKEINLVISGAGFTGIELACCLNRLAQKYNREIPVTLIEKQNRILTAISDEMLDEVEREIGRLGFKIIKNDYVEAFDGSTVYLKNSGAIPDAFFCWCSGVRMSVPTEGNHKKIYDDRIIVDEFLKIPEHPEVFVVGDAAAVMDKGSYLRRSVNYAAMMGKTAAGNIAAAISGAQGKCFKPLDLGWVIPVNVTSIGMALGHQIKGRLGILMHYIICGVKNYNFKNFMRFFMSAFSFAFQKKHR